MKRNVRNTKFQIPNTTKGITLVALAITIIVLLILAGVGINMAIDSDGLFGKANEAVTKWNAAVAEEDRIMQNILKQEEEINDKENPTQPLEIIETIEETGIIVKAAGGTDDYSGVAGYRYSTDNENWSDVIEEGKTYSIEYSEVATTSLPTDWDSSKVKTAISEGTRTAPIPQGYTESGVSSESSIASGLVIYETNTKVIPVIYAKTVDKVGKESEVYKVDKRETINQYVWIPVDDVNQMVMCKLNNANSDGTICNLELEGSQVEGYALRCKTHNAEGENTTMDKLCGRLYGTDIDTSTTPYTTSMNFSDRTQTWDDYSGYREPDIVAGEDTEASTGGLATFTEQMINDFVNMAISVEMYGGFYVSRYEAGENGASKKNQIVMTAGSSTATSTVYQGVNDWYGLYNGVYNEITVGESTMQSHMIYGSQYDQIINFIGSEAQKGHPGNVVTSQSETGTKETDRLNNIYDLEGNNHEWTAQAYNLMQRAYRGGAYNLANDVCFFPASYYYRYGFPTGIDSTCTTRSSLYLYNLPTTP